jgi:cobyrinic acid a,c-diamide synthase
VRAFCISAIASNQGKTILTTALLHHFRDSVRPYKVGPDFIDPQFHAYVCDTPSVNLDTYMMSEEQVRWIFERYGDRDVGIIEGVMGYYDGEDRGCSTYSVSKLLGVPTVLVLDGSGSYITLSAVLGGMLTYRNDHTIAAVVLNNLSSPSHYDLIRKQIEHDHPNLTVLGWIPKNLPALQNTHLGLDLEDKTTLDTLTEQVLSHIDTDKLTTLPNIQPLTSTHNRLPTTQSYPFPPAHRIDRTLAIVHDINFSFLYHDNAVFLEEVFDQIVWVDATADEPIPEACDGVYLPGGYVETEEAYARIRDAHRFRESLVTHAQTKPIYAECAGLLYLGQRVDGKPMSRILDAEFVLEDRYVRLGYYTNQAGVRGHAFHYTRPTQATLQRGYDPLSKRPGAHAQAGSWRHNNVLGTYLHTFLRANPQLLNLFKEFS